MQIDHVLRSTMVENGFRQWKVRHETDDVMVDKKRSWICQSFECSLRRSRTCLPTYPMAVLHTELSYASWQSV
jgi:hypothetical protein